MFCDTGKICYATIKEAAVAVANLNKQDKKHKHNYYKCPHCKMFHTSTVKSGKKKLAQKKVKYKFRYVPLLKEELPVKKKKTSTKKPNKMSTPESNAPQNRELTFGERAVGLTFNPSKDPFVDDIKRSYAKTIDMLNSARESTQDKERARMLSIAITETQTAQMWAVKAVTWQF